MAYKYSQSKGIGLGKAKVGSRQKGQPVVVEGEIVMSDLAQAPAANDCVGLVVIPKGHRLVAAKFFNDECDSDASDTLSFTGGLINTLKTDLKSGFEVTAAGKKAEAAKIIEADAIGGFTATDWAAETGYAAEKVWDSDRILGIKFGAVAAALVAAGKIRVKATCVPV